MPKTEGWNFPPAKASFFLRQIIMHLRRFFDLLSDLLSHQKFHALRERRPLAGRENPPQERFRIADGDDLNLPIDLPPVFLRDEGEGRARLLCGFELILHPAHGQNLPMQTDLAGQRQRIWHGRFRISRIEREEHRRPRRRSDRSGCRRGN